MDLAMLLKAADDKSAVVADLEGMAAGLWNIWTDSVTGEILESYTMLTVNADHYPLMSRMHKPDPKLPPDRQDKRSVVPIEPADVDAWLYGSTDEAFVATP